MLAALMSEDPYNGHSCKFIQLKQHIEFISIFSSGWGWIGRCIALMLRIGGKGSITERTTRKTVFKGLSIKIQYVVIQAQSFSQSHSTKTSSKSVISFSSRTSDLIQIRILLTISTILPWFTLLGFKTFSITSDKTQNKPG